MVTGQFSVVNGEFVDAMMIGFGVRMDMKRLVLLFLLVVGGMLMAAPRIVAQDGSTHVVEAGETLSEIAKTYGVGMDALMALNGITDPDALIVGQRLTLPEQDGSGADLPAAAATQAVTYTVQAGDSLSQIAKDFGMTLDALLAANGISDADRVIVGQVLAVPAVAESAPVIEATTDAAPAEEALVELESVTNSASETASDQIPAGEESAEPATSDATAAPTTTSLNPRYRVQSGDTLAGIALSFGVDVRALRAINGLVDTSNADLNAGQELILPATGDELRVIQPAQLYTVEAGDSLGLIAKAQGITLLELMDANGIRNPDQLNVGQELVLPPPADLEEVAAPPIGPQRRGFYYYTVQPGDTLSELAKEFDSTMLALMEFNSLPDEETVYTGLQLRIPFGAPPLPQVAPPVPLSGTSFLVSLSRQECWLFEGGQVRHRWTCSTGYGDSDHAHGHLQCSDHAGDGPKQRL